MTTDQTQAVTAERTWTVFNGAGAVEVENASDDELRDVLTDARLARGWTACSCVVVRSQSDLAALSSPVAAQPADSAMVQIPREAYLWLMGLGADGFAQDRPGAFWWRGAFNERANLDMTAIAQSKETPHER
jgi:hypothetical protein